MLIVGGAADIAVVPGVRFTMGDGRVPPDFATYTQTFKEGNLGGQ